MTDKHYNVLIPIVELGDDKPANNFLLRAYSSIERDAAKDAQASDIGIEPVAFSLMTCRLANAGMNALGAVRKLGLRKPKLAFYQWFKPQASINQQRLYCTDVKGPNNTGSAELGLALALLMGAVNTKNANIIATGRLAPKLDGEAELTRDRDAKIYPVGSVESKLRLLR
jgi:hypothetical protein